MSGVSSIATLAAVSAGCAIGAVARFEISRRIVQRCGDSFPWGTLWVNLTGCLLAGALLVSLNVAASPSWVAFLGAGILGGYTTVSSFSLETVLMFRRGHATGALIYIGASMFGCIVATGLGAMSMLWLAD
ncbi:MAG TPA: CrcB family protein [Wenzhouxiangellaceae bacterium]|nr:CrcB family protein [Wenzhouxiangellaceae bacterium]